MEYLSYTSIAMQLYLHQNLIVSYEENLRISNEAMNEHYSKGYGISIPVAAKLRNRMFVS